MPSSCSAYGCTNRKVNSDIHFYKFPFSRESVLKKWIHAVHRKNFHPTHSSRICSIHFRDDDFIVNESWVQKRLKPEAVPSIFTAFPEYLQVKPKKVRKTRERNVSDKTIETKKTKAVESKNRDQFVGTSDSIANIELLDLDEESKRNEETEHNEEQEFLDASSIVSDKKYTDIATETDRKEFVDVLIQTDESLLSFVPAMKQIKNENRVLKQHVKRQSIRIESMKDLLKELRGNQLVTEDYEEFLKSHFKGMSATIFINELKNTKDGKNKKFGNRYSEEMKRFAITLHYNSPKAYRFCRLHLTLPHPSCISAWISSVEANPGFMEEVLEAISKFPEENRDVNLISDAMSIKKYIQWDKKRDKMWGYCDYGQIEVESSDVPATEVLVFMCACLNGSWKLPIGYFFQDKCNASLLGELTKTAMHLCDRANLSVQSFTCDGTSTNWSSLKALGFSNRFDPSNIEFQLTYEYNGVKKTVYFTPDACHAAKLARNALAQYKKFQSDDGLVEWVFIERLHELQEKLHFKFANKLSATHIRFRNSVMKVKYAVQVLSSSVADAIEFLCGLGLPDFQGSEATVKFLRTVDRIFDFLNSRSPFGKGFKSPINSRNLGFLRELSTKWISYLLELKTVSGQPLYESPRKAFVVSFVTSIKSVLAVSEKLFLTRYYKYVLTYKFSQDLLELFFGVVRLRFGCNNNPTAYQFYFAMKTILLKNAITPSALGNCMLFTATEKDSYAYGNFLTARRKKEMVCENQDNDEEDEIRALFGEIDEIDPTGILREYILYYISGFIVRKLTLKVLDCVTCKQALLRSSTYDHDYCIRTNYDRFTQFKNRGGLVPASHDVFLIVKECEHYLIPYFDHVQDLKYSKIILSVQRRLVEYAVFKDLNCDCELFDNHKMTLIQHICALYLKIRIYSIVNWLNSRKVSKRKLLGKNIHFNND